MKCLESRVYGCQVLLPAWAPLACWKPATGARFAIAVLSSQDGALGM